MRHSTENNILQYITGKQTAEGVTVEELAAIADAHPSFGIAKFLLAKTAQKEGHPKAEKFAQTAILHFPNSYWFHFKLNEEALMKDETVTLNGNKGEHKAFEQIEGSSPETARQGETQQPGTTGSIEPEETVIADDLQFEAEVTAELETHQPGLEELIIASIENEALAENSIFVRQVAEDEHPTEDLQHREIMPVSQEERDVEHETGFIESNDEESISPEQSMVLPAEVKEDEHPYENARKPEMIFAAREKVVEPGEAEGGIESTGEESASPEQAKILALAPDEEEGHLTEDVQQAEIMSIVREEMLEPGDPDDTEDNDDYEAVIDEPPLTGKISSVLQEQLEEFKKPVTVETPLPIEPEPYHTVDYFASQGIKLSAEQQKTGQPGR